MPDPGPWFQSIVARQPKWRRTETQPLSHSRYWYWPEVDCTRQTNYPWQSLEWTREMLFFTKKRSLRS